MPVALHHQAALTHVTVCDNGGIICKKSKSPQIIVIFIAIAILLM